MGGGGGTQKHFSNFGSNRFSSGEIAQKTLSVLVRKNIIGSINLGHTSHLNLNNDIPDSRPALFT